eukprot:922262-Pelagomonas_calceolata.AAC.11
MWAGMWAGSSRLYCVWKCYWAAAAMRSSAAPARTPAKQRVLCVCFVVVVVVCMCVCTRTATNTLTCPVSHPASTPFKAPLPKKRLHMRKRAL